MSADGVNSEVTKITSRVPQGPMLGSLLFLLNVNNIPKAIRVEKLKLFADNTNLFIITGYPQVLESL
jgi:hypothetical protein